MELAEVSYSRTTSVGVCTIFSGWGPFDGCHVDSGNAGWHARIHGIVPVIPPFALGLKVFRPGQHRKFAGL